ncbi:MAG: PQQ-dependent sugar dehydrogenase [Gammaproteobacteria bacterium]|nr:PQQ-dependent sugar dehydrogenase [Gammaproteobacteria bacterium]
MKSILFRQPLAKGLLLMIPVLALAAEPGPSPLVDPLPDTIGYGDITVVAEPFARLPRTFDSASPPQTNGAYARIQYLQPLPDGSGRLVVNDLRGVLYLIQSANRQITEFLDLRTQNVAFDDSMFPNETGLAGVAFHPDYARSGAPGYGKFYTAYSASSDSGVADYLDDPANNHESVIREWIIDDPRSNVFSGSSRELLRVGQFAQNHNIGTLAFNPAAELGDEDYGQLYASFGDGGAANDPNENGQDLSNPLSSIIRIDPLNSDGERPYGVQADNPFVGQAGAAPEIWAYGLRHPQHFSFDRDGKLYIADIGQAQIEEINLGVAGANYGWRLREGTFATAFEPAFAGAARPNPAYPIPPADGDFTYPIVQYDHDPSNAISSVFVYRGDLIPQLQGKLVFSDMVTGRVFIADTPSSQPATPAPIFELRIQLDGEPANLASTLGFANTYYAGNRADVRLGIDAEGELYLLTKGDGWIRKLIAP